MFSQTAYEAFYTYIGLYLHEASIELITSQEVLSALLLLILGIVFLLGAWRYFASRMPGFNVRGVGLGVFVKILASFLLGVMLLKVDSPIGVKSAQRVTWSENQYIKGKLPNVEPTYKVSFAFALLTRSAEEIAHFMDVIVDKLFKKSNSEIEAPAAFYKAYLYSASSTIEDADLRQLINLYTEQCFSEVLPIISSPKGESKLDAFFSENNDAIDRELKLIPIQKEDGEVITCLDLKTEARDQLMRTSAKKFGMIKSYVHNSDGRFSVASWNHMLSSKLASYYLEKTESKHLGISKGAETPGGLASFFLGALKFFSIDGLLTITGNSDQVGAFLTAERARKFSEFLKRAPHIKGLTKLFLIAVFPWLVFLLFAGRWKVLISWYVVYVSVLLWTPIWTLLYHLMTSIALSGETLAAFGRLNDGISLYSAQLISSKLYHFYAIYSWLQLLLGPLPTVVLAWGMFGSFLRDGEEESAPQIVTAGKNAALTAATGGGAAGAAKAGIKSAL
ncbi:MAG: hypothetical protein CL678_12280 [Bdellovibrionaceae bacterium]|nr:hypothetical protein [Pseudobdellovibrionaceae bacterium]